MITFENIFYLIQNLLCIYITSRSLDLFIGKRNKNNRLFYMAILFYWLENSICCLIFGNSIINLISGILGRTIVAVVSYKAKIWKKLLAAISTHAVVVMLEDIIWFWVIVHFKYTELTALILMLLVYFIVEVVVEQCFVLKEDITVPKGYYLGMLVIPFGSIILTCILCETEEIYADNVTLALGIMIMVIMNALILFFFEKLINSIQEKWEKNMLEQKVLMYENQMEIISQAREKERALRHDLKNHLHLLSEFEKSGKHDEALSYIEVMDQFADVKKEIVSTGNEKIDAILNYMLEKAKNLGADLEIKVSIPKTEFCSVFDLNVILSNLLENAIEAIEICQDKRLQLIMEFSKGILYIRVANSFDGHLNKEGKRYLTRKEGSDEHGLGLRNIYKIAEKYEGTVEIMPKENMFYVIVVLYITGEND